METPRTSVRIGPADIALPPTNRIDVPIAHRTLSNPEPLQAEAPREAG